MPRSVAAFGRLLALALASGACVVSTDPVLTAADATFDARLVGTWAGDGDSDTAVLSRGAGGDYAMAYTTGGHTGSFQARLGRLGGRLVLDAWPVPGEHELPDSYKAMLLPAHLLVVVELEADELRASLLDADSLRAALAARPVKWRWEQLGQRLVLRGTTAELRAMLAPYLARPGVVGTPDVLRRLPPR